MSWKSGAKSWDKEKSWQQGQGWGWQDDTPRERLTEKRAVGVLVDWKHKAGQSFGWIVPIHGVDQADLPEACSAHGGDVYVHWSDIQDPRPGAVVTFWPTVDKQGLGAEDCQNRAVLRFVVPRAEVKQLALPPVEMNPCATYLTSSTFFPELEDHGATLRKYLWAGPLTVFELWGMPQDILAAAERIKLLAHPSAEALVSRVMARHEEPERLRDIEASDLPSVPPHFRVGLALKGGPDARERLLALLGE